VLVHFDKGGVCHRDRGLTLRGVRAAKREEPVMKEVTTYVGIDAHKKDLFIAMLIGNARTP
jgi:hypothetical protein